MSQRHVITKLRKVILCFYLIKRYRKHDRSYVLQERIEKPTSGFCLALPFASAFGYA